MTIFAKMAIFLHFLPFLGQKPFEQNLVCGNMETQIKYRRIKAVEPELTHESTREHTRKNFHRFPFG